MNRKACPDCGGELGDRATKCRCGWKATQTALMDANPNHVPCAANYACRYPGRMWLSTLPVDRRLCVSHYYRALEANPALAWDETVPPKRMPQVAKPVAGD